MRFAIYTLLALSPLPLASARPIWQWSWILFIALCVVAASIDLLKNKKSLREDIPGVPLMCVVLVVAWGLFQALLPLFQGHLALAPTLDTLSIDPEQTIKVSLLLLVHAALFLLVFLYVRGERKRISALIKTIAGIGALYALYGMIVYLSGSNHVLWFEKTAYLNVVTSTFINRNSYAAYAGLGLAAMNLFFFLKADKLKLRKAGRLAYLQGFFARHGWYQMLGYFVLLSALFLTGSRAGILSVLIAQAIFIFLSSSLRDFRSRLPQILAFSALLIAALVLSGDLLFDRILDNSEANERFTVYAYVLDAIRDRPLTGYGLGAFDEAFRLYRGEDVRLYFDRAHNDYLELAMTAGVPSALVLMMAPLLLMIRYLQAVTRASGTEQRAFAAMGIAVLVQLGLHSLFDFSLQMPAVSLLFVVLLALASARIVCPDRASESG